MSEYCWCDYCDDHAETITALKARVERLTKILNYVEEALDTSDEPWLIEAHQRIKQALAEQEGK